MPVPANVEVSSWAGLGEVRFSSCGWCAEEQATLSQILIWALTSIRHIVL